jgi:chromosome segregation ATPase
MKARGSLSLFLACLAAGLGPTGQAAEPANGDERIRAALRDTTVQLRSAQADLAALQSAQAVVVAEKKELADKCETGRKQAAADHVQAERSITALTAQLNDLKAQAARLAGELEKARAEGGKFAQAAHAAEEQGGKNAVVIAELQRRLADREQKNLALFLIGNEILTRYEEFSLGTALRAKEPFVGLTRTKLENLVQDYQDKLADQRIQP